MVSGSSTLPAAGITHQVELVPARVDRDLDSLLNAQLGTSALGRAVSAVILALAGVAASLSERLADGPLSGRQGQEVGAANADGDQQRALDVIANDLVVEALRGTSTAYYASEEEEAVLPLVPGGLLAVAVDPIDGSSGIDLNAPVGTIFTVFPAAGLDAEQSFLRRGSEQIASGYFIYGTHTALVVTTGHGVALLVLDRSTGRFVLAEHGVKIATETREFSINASNYRHWHNPVRSFINDCFDGAEGPRGKDFNMRWIASLVAEAHRIFTKGGVFLYPADTRKGYEQGRLRLLYEAFPISFLVTQAGGEAHDGYTHILEKHTTGLHDRTPLIFGSASKTALVRSYHDNMSDVGGRSALFSNRGIFRS